MSVKCGTSSISYLLNKYETKQPGECWTKKREKEYGILKWRMNQKFILSDNIINGFDLKATQKDRVKYIIGKVNFNKICRNCSNELIITV